MLQSSKTREALSHLSDSALYKILAKEASSCISRRRRPPAAHFSLMGSLRRHPPLSFPFSLPVKSRVESLASVRRSTDHPARAFGPAFLARGCPRVSVKVVPPFYFFFQGRPFAPVSECLQCTALTASCGCTVLRTDRWLWAPSARVPKFKKSSPWPEFPRPYSTARLACSSQTCSLSLSLSSLSLSGKGTCEVPRAQRPTHTFMAVSLEELRDMNLKTGH